MPAQPQPVVVPNSEAHFLESAFNGETYKLYVGLPTGYAESDARYPVVYAVPGWPDFFLLWATANLMTVSEELPSVIIVSTGYPSDDPDDILQGRIRDHMPTPGREMDQSIMDYLELDSLESGKAGQFLRFIQEEVQPFINTNYRTRPEDSTYAGFSSGGLFGLYVLFNHPHTFQRYILGSPPIFRANKAILDDEREYAASHDDLPAHVFLAVGGLEEDDPFTVIRPEHKFVTNVESLARTLEERGYPGLELTTEVLDGESHLSVVPAIYSRGLRAVFKQQTLSSL